MRSPLHARALRTAIAATSAAFLAAGLAGMVRLLPWLLDPGVTFRLAVPFARGLLALAGEAALVLGWPVGWALATAAMVDRGEARALAALGESPARAVARLGPQAAGFACVLAFVSFLGARDASEPGRVVTDLIDRGRVTCAAAAAATTYSVPLAGITWLCAPGAPPRLVGHGPGALAGATFTARDARASGDLREITLDDAHVALGLGAGQVHAGSLRIHGLSPFTRASGVPPLARALALALAAAIAAGGSVLALLRGAIPGAGRAIVLATAGALTALGAMRSVDRAGGAWLGALAVPALTLLAVLLTASLLARPLEGLRRRLRLPATTRAASKGIDHG